MNKILWFVKYGLDSSHMWEAKSFDKLKDAREFANNLPLSPTGGVRPATIERYEYVQSRVYGDIVKISEVKEITHLKGRIEQLEKEKAKLYDRCLENEEAMYDSVINGNDNHLIELVEKWG